MHPRPHGANDDDPRSPSLVEQAVARLRRPVGLSRPVERRDAVPPSGEWRAAAALALMIAAVPAVVWAGAGLLTAAARDEAARGSPAARPARMAAADVAAARTLMAALYARPVPGVVLERLAVALPREATLASIAVDIDGAMQVEIVTPDPDPVLAALRRDALLGQLRATGQRSGDGGMRITLTAAP